MRTAFAACGSTLIAASVLAAAPSGLRDAAAQWFESLDADQRHSALYAFEDDERFDLRLAPMGLEGLRRDDMSEAQWRAWLDVLETGLSESGRAKVETILSLEREVGLRDAESFFFGIFGGLFHGEQRYYVSLYGDPREPGPFGLRFDGHHVSLNFTLDSSGRLSPTPLFLGAEPREVPADWERAGLRALAVEEDRSLALWQALDPAQREQAQLPLELAGGPGGGNRPLFLGEGERVAEPTPVGVARATLRADQQRLLDRLIETYFANFEAELARARLAAIDAAGRDAIHFAFAGSLAAGEPGYYRIQGPTFLIEWDDTMPEADHVHTILREFDGDFGRDLLGLHYAQAHALRGS